MVKFHILFRYESSYVFQGREFVLPVVLSRKRKVENHVLLDHGIFCQIYVLRGPFVENLIPELGLE